MCCIKYYLIYYRRIVVLMPIEYINILYLKLKLKVLIEKIKNMSKNNLYYK